MIDKNYLVLSPVPINANVPDGKIDPYIPKAMRDLRGILDVGLFEAVSVLSESVVPTWSGTNAYLTGQRVLHSEYGVAKMWQAVQNSTGQVPSTSNTANWSEVELGTFLDGYVRPWLAHHVYVGYAVNGGVNVTHQGLQEINNETASAVSGNKLDAYLSYWQAETRQLRTAMLNYLDEAHNTLDGVTYIAVENDRRKRNFKINAIGGKPDRTTYYDKWL
jgi:hypothetical protein